MDNSEIIQAICQNHVYEYVLFNRDFEVVDYSERFLTYVSEAIEPSLTFCLFDVAVELIGMESIMLAMMDGDKQTIFIPCVCRDTGIYINLYVKHSTSSDTLILLLEDVSHQLQAQHYARQIGNENLLLLEEIAEKNRRLEIFNAQMQRLVEEEVAKNLEKQHMLELQTRHAQMGEMIAMITHQWKQPLSVIQTVGTALKIKYERGIMDKALLSQKLDILLEQARYLLQTVNDFQDFFKPSKEKSDFILEEAIASVLTLMQEIFVLHTIDVVFCKTSSTKVYGFENQYKQVILALLQNAKEALVLHREKQRCITIRIEAQGAQKIVHIEDNAGGVPPEVISEIFEPFVTTKEEGSGLGLHIAKSVIENNMQGKLWVENIPNGARFSISI